MITDLLFFLIGIFVNAIAFILSALNFVIPSYLITSVTDYLHYFSYAQGVFPIVHDSSLTGMVASVGITDLIYQGVLFLVLWYSFKVALWVFHLIPWIGKHLPHPGVGSHQTSDIHHIGPTEAIAAGNKHITLRPRRDASIK